ncbi:MAG TPA: hypothetical protein VJT49_04925 [Amycolatopsis sp.]|uniref:hypothetical protein n=1 Tax=Amycolatopsis sp. TaxID=37632 RepID=UPI002B465E98|nr:hypothetical protein [Amycolatopsis sp.]HKS44452.1 hypothetical protein [Amycolatopsis sp.]
MTTRANRQASALAALSANEKATVLDELLATRPDLRQLAENHAVRLMSAADRTAVADDVASALRDLDIEELNGHAGYRPRRGYVHPVEAADEILDEALEPFLRDLERRAALGMATAATELAAGILLGLYECRDGGGETLLEYSPDYPAERAADVVDRCAKLHVNLPRAEVLDLLTEWDGIVAGRAGA